MGADIHGFWEVKDHTGNWMAIDTVNPARNYMWFGIIAGVRGGPDIGTAHRGIPEKLSGAYRDLLDDWGADLHSHTWLSIDEVQEACKELNNRLVEAYNDPYDDPYESIPYEDMKLSQLIIGWGSTTGDREHIAWDWFGTLQELMAPTGDIKTDVRMVVCFDS